MPGRPVTAMSHLSREVNSKMMLPRHSVATAPAKKIGLFGLIAIGYFWVSGGMYGLETMIAMGPTAYVLLAMMLTPIFYSFPISVIISDLAVAFPLDGGSVAWVDHQFGGAVGSHNAYWTWTSYIVHAAVYPVFAGHYLTQVSGLSDSWYSLFAEIIVVLIMLARTMGFDFLVRFSVVLATISILPTAIFIFAGLRYAESDPWLNTSGDYSCTASMAVPPVQTCKHIETQWGALLSMAIWAWGGFYDMGTLAGQVRHPKKDIMIATAVLIGIAMCEIVLPLALAVSVDGNLGEYEEGTYVKIGQKIGGSWLKVLITIAAINGQVGMCNGIAIVADEALQSILLRRVKWYFDTKAKSSWKSVRWLWKTKGGIAPVIAIFNSVLMALFVWIPFDVIIAVSALLQNLSVLLVFAAYIMLKRTNRNAHWVFGRSTLVAVLLMVSPTAFTLVQSYFALFDFPKRAGVPYLNLITFISFIAFGFLVHFLGLLIYRLTRGQSKKIVVTPFNSKSMNKVRRIAVAAAPVITVSRRMSTFVTPIEASTLKSTIQLLASQSPDKEAFMVLDIGDVYRKHVIWRRTLPRVEPFYAVKCNGDTMVIQALASLKTGFDCASVAEIESVLNADVDPTKIIYAHPCKAPAHIIFAKEHGVEMMTFDNEAELRKICDIYPRAKLVIRIHTDDTKAIFQLGKKFGVSTGDVGPLLQAAYGLGMEVIGVSFHVGSGCFDATAYSDAIKAARKVFDTAAKFGRHMHLLDIGGGFPGESSAPISFPEIAIEALDEFFPTRMGVRVIAEPGRYFVASAGSVAVNVISKRKIKSEKANVAHTFFYYVNDGVYGTLNSVLYDKAFLPIPKPLYDKYSSDKYTSTFWGPTCDSLDCITTSAFLPELDLGDWIVFNDVGAYSISTGTTFNGFPLPSILHVFMVEDDEELSRLPEGFPLPALKPVMSKSSISLVPDDDDDDEEDKNGRKSTKSSGSSSSMSFDHAIKVTLRAPFEGIQEEPKHPAARTNTVMTKPNTVVPTNKSTAPKKSDSKRLAPESKLPVDHAKLPLNFPSSTPPANTTSFV